MNLPFQIAKRYLFAKKSTNAINIISGITVFGISVGTAALVIVLSVFNGFEDLLSGLFRSFNPDIKITPYEGKTFPADTLLLEKIQGIDGVEFISQTLEEVAYFEYKKNHDFGILKGVDENYNKVTGIDSTIREGKYQFTDGNRNLVVLGVGMRNKLSVNIADYLAVLNVYMPTDKNRGPLAKPFKKLVSYPRGTFVIQQDFDGQYILSSLEFARKLLGKKNGEVSALEIKTKGDEKEVARNIQKVLGDKFVVKDRYQQDEAFLKLMNIEKWMSFAILSLSLILIAFNMIGSLWMIVLEKKKDIGILKAMGANNLTIRNIFLNEGLMLTALGMISGFTIALLLYGAQKAFGIVPIPAGFLVDAYPISIRFWDFMAVAIAVALIGFLASLPAAIRATRVEATSRM